MRVPWTNFGSEARRNFKLHDPCEVSQRIWKAQNSPRLLPWIYSVLRLKYAEPSKFTVLKIDFEGAKKLQHKNFILRRSKETSTEKFHFVKEQRNSSTEISFCKGAKKLQYTNFELNEILIQREARERVKDTLPHKLSIVITKRNNKITV